MNKNENDMENKPKYNKVDAFLHKHIDPNFWTILIVLTVVLVFLGGVAVYDHASDVADDSDLAQRLGDSGWVLFTTSWCPSCDVQKDILGSTVGLTVVECDANNDARYTCASYNVSTVPTWYNIGTGEFIEELQTVERLELMII